MALSLDHMICIQMFHTSLTSDQRITVLCLTFRSDIDMKHPLIPYSFWLAFISSCHLTTVSGTAVLNMCVHFCSSVPRNVQNKKIISKKSQNLSSIKTARIVNSFKWVKVTIMNDGFITIYARVNNTANRIVFTVSVTLSMPDV